MKKKFLASILVGAIVCSSNTLVFASEKTNTNNNSESISKTETSNKVVNKDTVSTTSNSNKNEKITKENSKPTNSIEKKDIDKKSKAETNKKDTPNKNIQKDTKEKNTVKENNSKISTKDHQEIINAVEEMREAGTLLDNSDLTNKANVERMDKFSKAALTRIQNISTENLPQNFKDNVQFVKEMGQQIEESSHNINRLLIAINNVETVFSRENETLESKNNVLDTLNTVITQERESGVLNKSTLNSAITTLQNYAAKLPADDPDSQDKNYYLKEITYAVEEMREAGTLLDNSDLTKKANVERMDKFSKTALTRIENIPIEKLPQNLKDNITFIKETGQQIEESSHNINRLLIAINNVETVFSRENETLESKNNVLDTLNTVITQERESGVLNKSTLNSAITTLQKYAAELPDDDPEAQDKDYNLKQMTYAVEEMREAVTLLDNADFTNKANYERMIRFVTASLDRSRGLDLSKNKDLLAHYEWIEESGDSIRNATHNIMALNALLNNTEKIFNPNSHSTEQQKTAALNELEKTINKEENLRIINKTTLNKARTILNEYAKNMPIKPTNPTIKPDEPTIKPNNPTIKPDTPTTKPTGHTIKPNKPIIKPDEPTIKPNEPIVKSNDSTVAKTNENNTNKEESTVKLSNNTTIKKLPRTGGHSSSALAGLGIISALIGVFIKK